MEVLDLIKSLSANLETFQASIKTSMAETDTRLKSLEEQFKKTHTKNYGSDPVPQKQWSWARFAFATARKDWRHAPFEKAEVDAHTEKVMQASDFTTGGSLVPPQYVAELIDALRPTLVASQLGVRVLTGLNGSPVIFPKLTARPTVSWIGPEGTTIPATDATTGRLELVPRKAAGLVKLSNDLLMLANPSIEASVRADIGNGLVEALDQALFAGTGASGQPTGLENTTPAITSAGAWSGSPTNPQDNINLLMDAIKTVANLNALGLNPKFAMNINSFFALSKQVDVDKRYYLVPDPAQPRSRSLFGYPVVSGTNVSGSSTNTVWFGNWDDAILAIWSAMEVVGSQDAGDAFANDQLWLRAILRADVGFRRTASFAKVTAVT